MSAARSGHHRSLQLIVLVVAVLLFAACGDDAENSTVDESQSGDGVPAAGGDATLLLYSEIGSLDPARFTGSGGAEGQRAFALYGALVAFDAKTGETEPVLAESLEPISDDFTKWELKLKPGITFSDGSAYNAEAVKVNWELRMNPSTRSPSFTALMSVTELTAVDDTTLEIGLSEPNAHFDNTVSRGGLNYIASAEAIRDGVDMTSTAVGAGPFLLEEWLRDDRMVMTANPDWKGSDGPFLNTLTFRVIGDEDQRVDTFNTGQADGFYTATPASVLRAQEAIQDAYFTSVDVTTGQTLVFNTARPPFNDVRVRKAFVQGVNWQALADTVFGEGAEALTNFTMEGTPWYTEEAALPPFDPEEAQRLIDEYIAETGGPITVTYTAFQQSLDQARADFIQTSLSQLDGIAVDVAVGDSPTNIQNVLAGNYMVSSWGFPVVAPDPGIFNAAYSQAFTNYAKYNNPDVDALLIEARKSADDEANAELYQKVFAQLAEDIPFYPYVETTNGFVLTPELQGGRVYEDGILRVDLLWLDD